MLMESTIEIQEELASVEDERDAALTQMEAMRAATNNKPQAPPQHSISEVNPSPFKPSAKSQTGASLNLKHCCSVGCFERVIS